MKVQDGWLTLSGQVDWNYQRTAAMQDLGKLRGVIGITNEIVISTRVNVTDVAHRIEDAFKRHADVEAKGVRVTSLDGKVKLEGKVATWSDRQARRAGRMGCARRPVGRRPSKGRVENGVWGGDVRRPYSNVRPTFQPRRLLFERFLSAIATVDTHPSLTFKTSACRLNSRLQLASFSSLSATRTQIWRRGSPSTERLEIVGAHVMASAPTPPPDQTSQTGRTGRR